MIYRIIGVTVGEDQADRLEVAVEEVEAVVELGVDIRHATIGVRLIAVPLKRGTIRTRGMQTRPLRLTMRRIGMTHPLTNGLRRNIREVWPIRRCLRPVFKPIYRRNSKKLSCRPGRRYRMKGTRCRCSQVRFCFPFNIELKISSFRLFI